MGSGGNRPRQSLKRSTAYRWGSQTSPTMPVNVGLGQGSALSPTLSGLYIAPALHVAVPVDNNENKELMGFVDDINIYASSKDLKNNIPKLCHTYNELVKNFKSIGLMIEHSKTELMHFTKKKDPTFPTIDLGIAPHTGNTPLTVKPIWRYLGFFLDRKLSFAHHVQFYATKSMSTCKAMLMLGNSLRGLSPKQKRVLYRSCVVPIITYGFQLWWCPNGKGVKGLYKLLQKTQNAAAKWIIGAFRTSHAGGMETLAGLPPIRFPIA